MIVNVIDTEWDGEELLEIGLTTVDVKARAILNSYSLPRIVDKDISPEISKLTGWTNRKLAKRGLTDAEIERRLTEKYGWKGRTVVMDTNNEFPENHRLQRLLSASRLNVSLLFSLKTGLMDNLGLDSMLSYYGLVFIGQRHNAKNDSFNIARLFLKVMYDQAL